VRGVYVCGERGTRAKGVGALNLDVAKKWRKLVIMPDYDIYGKLACTGESRASFT
jgi:hypothetical protein